MNFGKRFSKKENDSVKAFIYSFMYVGLGTIAVLCSYGADPCFGDWSMYLYVLTFPVTLLGGVIRFGLADGYMIPVLIAQAITLILTWRLILFVMRK